MVLATKVLIAIHMCVKKNWRRGGRRWVFLRGVRVVCVTVRIYFADFFARPQSVAVHVPACVYQRGYTFKILAGRICAFYVRAAGARKSGKLSCKRML